MALATYIADTSAFSRIKVESVASRLSDLLERGLVSTCAVLDLEALFSAQSPTDYEKIWTYRGAVFEYLETTDHHMQRALEVQRELAAQSRHRAVKLPDLIIAAVAEHEKVTLLHYDHDFDLIAGVTGQATEWVVPQGSV